MQMVERLGTVDWADIRSRYPAAQRWTFLNSGSRGLVSRAAHAAGVASLDADLSMQADSPPVDRQLIEVRKLFETLVKAEPGTVAVTQNVSHGLNIVASGLDWRHGDEVVTSSDIEHANNVYLWEALKADGVALRDIPALDGVLDTDAMIAAIGPRTRLVTVSSVSFVPGLRADLARIGAACRRHDVLFLVDGVQSCGILDVDVAADCVDALVTSTSKGMLGVRGLGFLYVAPQWIKRLKSAFIARNSVEAGGHYSEFEGAAYQLKDDARRFECGNYNYTGIAVARVAMREILGLGTDRTEARAVKLATQLAEGLKRQGWPVVDPPKGVQRSHLVCLGTRGPGGPSTTGDARLDALAAALEAADVKFAVRRRLIRFGFNFYNDETDVNHVLGVAADMGVTEQPKRKTA